MQTRADSLKFIMFIKMQGFFLKKTFSDKVSLKNRRNLRKCLENLRP